MPSNFALSHEEFDCSINISDSGWTCHLSLMSFKICFPTAIHFLGILISIWDCHLWKSCRQSDIFLLAFLQANFQNRYMKKMLKSSQPNQKDSQRILRFGYLIRFWKVDWAKHSLQISTVTKAKSLKGNSHQY